MFLQLKNFSRYNASKKRNILAICDIRDSISEMFSKSCIYNFKQDSAVFVKN